jgi:hypothetical protein
MQKNTNKLNVLLGNGYILLNSKGIDSPSINFLATIFCNMAYFGFIPSKEVCNVLEKCSDKELNDFWAEYEPIFKNITFTDRDMSDFVVYKNFPAEVLNMTESEYWFKQLFIYYGLPVSLVREEVLERAHSEDKKVLKVLSLSNEETLKSIYNNLVNSKNSWNDGQKEEAIFLLKELNVESVVISNFGFKENAILIAKEAFENSIEIEIGTATDVLRFGAALSNGDISLRSKTKFRNFTRSERKEILSILNNCEHIVSDFGLRKEMWKIFLFKLHSGDYKFENVNNAVNLLYNNKIKTLNSVIESKLSARDSSVLVELAQSKGDFVRRFHKLYSVYGKDVIETFEKMVPSLEVIQLLKFKKYITTINERSSLIVAPRGNWSRAKVFTKSSIVESVTLSEAVTEMVTAVSEEKLRLLKESFGKNVNNEIGEEVPVKTNINKVKIQKEDLDCIVSVIDKELGLRLEREFKSGVDLDVALKNVKIPSNDQSLAVNYGRGSVFTIPEDTKVIRTSSYWKIGVKSTSWFDNGWCFFDDKWNSAGAICWNSRREGAVFSGDPISGNNEQGEACQLIDLDLDKLKAEGVRYCVWNILSYSSLFFDDVNEIVGTLQFAEDSMTGQLFEPSRVHLSFQLKGKSLSKYVAYLDLETRQIVYMDSNLGGNIYSAESNLNMLASKMPVFVEYLNTLPSVYEMFENAPVGDFKILYTDKDLEIKDKVAYVFKRENDGNSFENIGLSKYLK